LPLQHREYLLVANEVHHLLVHELAVQLGQEPAVPDHQLVQRLFVLQVGVFHRDAVIYKQRDWLRYLLLETGLHRGIVFSF